MKKIKRIIALFLTVCMIASTPLSAMAAETVTPQSDEDLIKVLHLDNGRKYFSKDWIIALINEMEAAGYTHLELAFGNDGLRFLLDDMSVGSYSDDAVTAAIQAGNEAYNDAGDKNELTQAEMDAIIKHANDKGIEIIPLLNNPGHMDVIVSAINNLTGTTVGYNGSSSTIDLENTTAVNFTNELVGKYITYFQNKGCTYFNMGADEYANDIYSSGSMGFGALVSAGKYQLFVDYVNTLAEQIKNAGMTPMAFNDGIYFNNATSYEFDTDIVVAFWTSGWSGYQSASASTMAGKGHPMLNVHGDYYFVLKTDGTIQNPSSTALNFDNSTFMGSNVDDPIGSMFCIWCDNPDLATEQEVAAAVRITLRKMAAAMNDTDSYSEEVVSGGFNEDGSIAETREWKTVTAESNSSIQVSGYDLTSAEATEVASNELPSIDGTENTKAWDITPYVGDTAYAEKGTVSLPVPTEWNTSLLKGFYIENGEAVLVEGTYADGKYTFDMPHFSVAGIAEISYDKLIELNVGESKTELIDGVDLTGQTYIPEPAGIATISTSLHTAVTGEKLVQVTSLDNIVSGEQYVLVNNRSGNILGNEVGSASTWGTSCIVQENGDASVNSTAWTITKNGENYQLTNSDGNYMTIGNNSSNLSSNSVNLTIHDYNNGTFAIGQTVYQTTYYLNDMGAGGQYAGGYNVLSDAGAPWYLYQIVDEQGTSGTDVTFTGTAAGETYVTINDVVYKIVVHGTVDITINYKNADGNLIKTETVSVVDNATTYNVSNFNYNDKYYVVDDTVLNISPSTATSYDVTVTETAEDLSTVTPLEIDYWITNRVVYPTDLTVTEETDTSGTVIRTYSEYSAEIDGVYSEAGIAFSDLVPETGLQNGKEVVLWNGVILNNATNEQTNTDGDDEHKNGTIIEYIRYWNGAWEYKNGDNWVAIDLTNNQIVAYYLLKTEVTDEVTTSVIDWAQDYAEWQEGVDNSWFWEGYVENGTKYVFLDFAVVYEDGTQNPAEFPTDNTWFYHFYGCSETNPRVIGDILFTENGNYEIWKITETDGTSDGYSSVDTFESTYDDSTETIIWDETMGGDPYIESLTYTANRSGKLIRVYVRAVETEDTLTVVYYDEKFGDTLYSYNISVENNTTFNNGIVGEQGFATNADRIDVREAYITNALGKNQYFETDLTQVPEAVGKYNSELYEYTGSVISEDGKTLYLYYNIDTEVLSPMFVVDYGNPFTFDLSKVVGEGQAGLVEEVTVNENTRYGTLEYNSTSKQFTYTPTQVLPNIDVLTINIKFENEDSATTTNAGVMPATTVDYEEGFATLTGFTGGTAGSKVQTTQVAGKSSDEYGYDAKVVEYANTCATSTTKGDTAEFTFTGTGVDMYVNSADASGDIAIQVRDAATDRLKKVISVKTTSNSTITGAYSGSEQKGLIAASVTGLTYGQYSVKITTTEPGTDGVYFDGFRVYGTIQDQKNIYYTDDYEDDPIFLELRDYVLTSVDVANSDSAAVYAQIREATDETLTGVVLNKTGSTYSGMDLLENGPKNELFLLPGQSVVFNLTTAREVQVGLKAIGGTAKVTGISEEPISISTERDMFYTALARLGEGVAAKEQTVTITNDSTSDSILSITKVKICDDPNATFGELEADDLVTALGTLGYGPEEPETPVEPTPGTPEEPTPGTPDEPSQEPEHECIMKEEIQPATTMKDGKIIVKCEECGEVESTKIIRKASNVKLSMKALVYNGKQKNPKVIVKDSKGNVIDAKYYKVTKPKGRTNVGKYTYTVKFNGLYKGTKKLTLTVKPKATAIKSVTAAKKAFTVKWSKVSKQATGYEIMYATNAKFTKGKHTVKVTKLNTTSKKISKLKANKKYYVKVRTYKTVKVNGKQTKIYSNWSKYRTVTTKR